MGSKRITLKDVSLQTGASLSTVHRALYHKTGVSDEFREFIVNTANQMGYKPNYVASSLKRKTIQFAILLPAPSLTNRYFYRDLWKGLRDFKAEVQQFNVKFLEFTFSGSGSSQAKELENIYNLYADDLSGLITIALNDASISYFIDKFTAKNIPVVLISSDMQKSKRLCCVRAHDKIAGNLAAEWIGNFSKDSGKVIVAAGDIVTFSHERNVEGFEDYLSKSNSQLEIVKIYDRDDPDYIYSAVLDALKKSNSIRALYSCTARDTVAICRAVTEMNLQQKTCVVGSDIFEESVQFLKGRVIQAIIYKNPYKQAYLGMKTLFDYVIKGEYPPNSTVFVIPTVIMNSNLPFVDTDEEF